MTIVICARGNIVIQNRPRYRRRPSHAIPCPCCQGKGHGFITVPDGIRFEGAS